MHSQQGEKFETKVNEFNDKLKMYLFSLFKKWKRLTPKLIKEKILYPLFKINDDNTIGLYFPNEVNENEVILNYVYVLFILC